MKDAVGMLGFGYCVPSHIRTNDDPIFRGIKETANSQGISEKSLFTGTKERCYLLSGEQLSDLMIDAAQQALAQADLKPEQIDRLYGYASVSEFITPNALYKVHAALKLPSQTLVVPINSEFSNFITSVVQAWEAIVADHCQNALVVCGCHWTKYVDYNKGHSLSVGDGAGAVVIGRSNRFKLIAYESETLGDQYDVMTLQYRVGENSQLIPTYDINSETGIQLFMTLGMEGPPRLIKSLLKRHNLAGNDIALIAHQASRQLMEHWSQSIQPKEYFDTFEQFGNLTLASIPVTLACCFNKITADYVVLAALGVGFHQVVLLIKT